MADWDKFNKYEQKMSSRGQAEANARELPEMRGEPSEDSSEVSSLWVVTQNMNKILHF